MIKCAINFSAIDSYACYWKEVLNLYHTGVYLKQGTGPAKCLLYPANEMVPCQVVESRYMRLSSLSYETKLLAAIAIQ